MSVFCLPLPVGALTRDLAALGNNDQTIPLKQIFGQIFPQILIRQSTRVSSIIVSLIAKFVFSISWTHLLVAHAYYIFSFLLIPLPPARSKIHNIMYRMAIFAGVLAHCAYALIIPSPINIVNAIGMITITLLLTYADKTSAKEINQITDPEEKLAVRKAQALISCNVQSTKGHKCLQKHFVLTSIVNIIFLALHVITPFSTTNAFLKAWASRRCIQLCHHLLNYNLYGLYQFTFPRNSHQKENNGSTGIAS